MVIWTPTLLHLRGRTGLVGCMYVNSFAETKFVGWGEIFGIQQIAEYRHGVHFRTPRPPVDRQLPFQKIEVVIKVVEAGR